MLALETHHLRKQYDRTLAVDDMSLAVQAGEAFGLLGANGAGKSTCLKMLLGLARPTSGGGALLGRPLGEAAVRARIGFLPEHFQFQDWLSGAEVLRLHGRLVGMDAARLRRRIPEMLARVGLDAQGAKPLRQYSKGMQQRIGLAQALLHEPEIVFLDEPTSGLDPLGRRLVRELIAEQRARGATVFLNSHLLSEVEVSCDRVAFVKAGRILETRTLGDAAPATRIRLRGRRLPPGWQESVRPASVTALAADVWTVELDAELAPAAFLRGLIEAGAEIEEFTPLRPSLEEVFLSVVGNDGGGT